MSFPRGREFAGIVTVAVPFTRFTAGCSAPARPAVTVPVGNGSPDTGAGVTVTLSAWLARMVVEDGVTVMEV